MNIPENIYVQEGLSFDQVSGLFKLVENDKQAYILYSPLNDKKYKYTYKNGVVLLQSGFQGVFISLDNDLDLAEEYVDDFIQDITTLSDKFGYDEHIGRPRAWKKLIYNIEPLNEVYKNYHSYKFEDKNSIRITDLLISLIIGSINNVDNISIDEPAYLLDKIKNKIQLFDGDQTRFIYETINNKKIIKIQGLSGSGKTELLLHKLKEIYIQNSESKILFTCHNRILARDLKRRIPDFFNFMRVEKQIDWNNLLCVHAWGNTQFPYSGAYRYITNFYGLSFHTYSKIFNFDKVCQKALSELNNLVISEFAFDYIFIDESQDFPDSFIKLCEKVCAHTIFVAGDVFQNIFENKDSEYVEASFILKKCYRTDPRTLMFSHGLGLGVFENTPIMSLKNADWISCGYSVENIGDNNIRLTRAPARRFEDLQAENVPSIFINVINENFVDQAANEVLQIIETLRKENPSLKPEDIGVICLDYGQYVYGLIDTICHKINRNLNWSANNAVVTKQKEPNSVFVSNVNNVKGLEFPFVICISYNVVDSESYRNSLYMTLTRSFLQTYFIMSNYDQEMINIMQARVNEINENNSVIIKESNETIKNKIKLTNDDWGMSLDEFIDSKLQAVDNINDDYVKIKQAVKILFSNSNNYDSEKVNSTIISVLDSILK